MNEGIALKELLNVNKVMELRTLDIFAYKIKCKKENQLY